MANNEQISYKNATKKHSLKYIAHIRYTRQKTRATTCVSIITRSKRIRELPSRGGCCEKTSTNIRMRRKDPTQSNKKRKYSKKRRKKKTEQQELESDRKRRWARRGHHLHKGHSGKNTTRRKSPGGLTLATYGHRKECRSEI